MDAGLLGLLGESSGADHVYFAEVTRGPDGGRLVHYRVEWCAPGVASRLGDERLQSFPWGTLMPAAGARLERGEPVAGAADEFPEPDRSHLAIWGAASVAMLPVVVGGELVGVLGLDSVTGPRPWSAAEVALLAAAAAALAAARERLRSEQALAAAEEQSRRLVEGLPVGVYRTTPDGRVLLCNAEAARLTGWAAIGAAAPPILEDGTCRPPYPREDFRTRLEQDGVIRGLEAIWTGPDGRDRVVRENARLVKPPGGAPAYYEGTLEDVTERVRAEELSAGQNRVLERIAHGEPLPAVLEELTRVIEAQAPGVVASILLLGPDGRLRHGAAPGLPDEYTRAVDGLPIGPDVGSCGSAAYRNEPVAVADVATDPRWKLGPFPELALKHGLRACWSTPIRARDGRVLGTFALYARRPGRPEPAHEAAVEAATHLAAVAIEQAQAAAALQASERRFRALVENSFDAVTVLAADGTVVYDSPTATRLVGQAPDEALGLPVTLNVHADDQGQVSRALAGLLERPDEPVRNLRVRVWHTDGSLLWVEASLHNLLADPAVGGIVVNWRDVSEYARAEESLRQSETLARLVWENSGDGMRLTDEAGTVRLVNRAYCDLVGMPRAAVEGRPMAAVYAASRHDEILRKHGARFAQRAAESYVETAVELWDGRRRWFEASKTLLEIPGEPPLMLSLVRDVTDRKLAEQALRASEERHRTLMEQASDAIFVFDAAGRLVEVNPPACALLGWRREELLGRPARDVVAGSDPAARLLPADRARAATFERALRHRDGAAVPVEVSLKGLDDGRQIAIARDIRARKAAERELRVARYALENAPEAIVLIGADGRLLDVNEAACRRLGYGRAELLRLAVWDIDPAVQQERWPARWERLKRVQRHTFEATHRTRDGRLIPVEVTSGIWNYDGQEYITAFCRDITARREAEEALRFFKFTADRTADPVYWLRPDRGFRFTYVNRAACAHFGRVQEDLLQMRLSDLDLHLTPEALGRLWADLALARRSTVMESAHRRADGTLVPVEVSANRIEFGGLEYLTGYIRDISERRRAEAELSAARGRAAESEKMRALGQVAGGVAHDFNNALMAVLGLTEVLLTRPDVPAEAKAFLTTIRTAGQDAHETVRRLQLFARQGEAEAARQVLLLNQVVADVPTLTRHRWADEAQRRGATIRFVADLGAAPPVAVNPSEIREVLVNLIFNAVDAMPQGGTLALTTGARDGRAFAAVRDTGVGMGEETRRRCLEPFFTTKGYEGTGIGLAVSWSIVQRHGGEIEVTSQPGEGSAFTVWLPAAGAGKAEGGRRKAESETPPPDPATRLPPPAIKRVLVIDDQAVVAQAVAALLTRLGYTVEVAGGGQEGIDRFRAAAHDAVITDLGMPDVDGAAVAAAVKAHAPGAPVLLLTGWGEDLLAAGDRFAGVDHIVAKPITLQKLREALDRLFQPPHAPEA